MPYLSASGVSIIHKTLYKHAGFITFRVSRRRREVHNGQGRLCVCLSVCLAVFPHYRTDPDVTRGEIGNGRGCFLVAHYCADLQSVHGFRSYDNIARTWNVSECLYSPVPGFASL